jgi:hypothetical protein
MGILPLRRVVHRHQVLPFCKEVKEDPRQLAANGATAGAQIPRRRRLRHRRGDKLRCDWIRPSDLMESSFAADAAPRFPIHGSEYLHESVANLSGPLSLPVEGTLRNAG